MSSATTTAAAAIEHDSNATLRNALLPLPVHAIVFVENGTASEAYAVGRLQHWLDEACNYKPQVVAEAPASGHWLAVGHLAATTVGLAPPGALLPPPLPLAPPTSAGHDAFAIRCDGGNCAVSGGVGSLRGTMYGVFELLEHWGFKFLAYDTTIVPPCPGALPSANMTVRPTMSYRLISDVYTEPARPSCVVNPNCTHKGCSKLCDSEQTVATRNQWSSSQGNVTVGWPRNTPYAGPPGFCHTSLHFANPMCTSCNVDDPSDNRTLFEAHPEFFWPSNLTAHDVSSLCWAAPGLADTMIHTIRKWIQKWPMWGVNATYMSLTQEDTGNVCMSDLVSLSTAVVYSLRATLRLSSTTGIKLWWTMISYDIYQYHDILHV